MPMRGVLTVECFFLNTQDVHDILLSTSLQFMFLLCLIDINYCWVAVIVNLEGTCLRPLTNSSGKRVRGLFDIIDADIAIRA